MALSNTAIINAKPRDKNYRLYDEKGLYLEVTKSGGKLWRLKYRFGGKEKRLAIGSYPERSLRSGSRGSGIRLERSLPVELTLVPINRLKKPRSLQTAAIHSRRWHASGTPGKAVCGARYTQRNVLDRLEKNVFPYVGSRALPDITVPELLKLLRRIEAGCS